MVAEKLDIFQEIVQMVEIKIEDLEEISHVLNVENLVTSHINVMQKEEEEEVTEIEVTVAAIEEAAAEEENQVFVTAFKKDHVITEIDADFHMKKEEVEIEVEAEAETVEVKVEETIKVDQEAEDDGEEQLSDDTCGLFVFEFCERFDILLVEFYVNFVSFCNVL
jgi:hypothetical protein